MRELIIGSRGSQLALWQANYIRDLILDSDDSLKVTIKSIRTRGDGEKNTPLPQVGDKGFFTAEIESALRSEQIDLAVHSLKDLPAVLPEGLKLGAIPPRESAMDVLVSLGGVSFSQLPEGAVIATSSVRRKAQLLHLRPDLRFVEVRGNIHTRLKKLKREGWDGLIMAEAALDRLDLTEIPRYRFTVDEAIPAAGQGAIAVEVAQDRTDLRPVLTIIQNDYTFEEVETELYFISLVEGGCQVPAAAYAEVYGNTIELIGMVASLDGKDLKRDTVSGDVKKNKQVADDLFASLVRRGAREILAEARDLSGESVWPP